MHSHTAPSDSDLQAVALTGRTLGALFYYEPDRPETSDLINVLRDSRWVYEWPCGEPEALQQSALLMQSGLTEPQDEPLEESYQRLFIGPNPLLAPPWGSVYLDHEKVIFGESTLELRRWQAESGVKVQLQQREPEDHIGLMLMQSSWLAEHEPQLLAVLLEKHLLPWSSRYLSLLVEHAQHPFYQGLAALTQTTLDDWQQRLAVIPEQRQIYS